MSLATSPVSDARGNSKGVMSQDSDATLLCHCNLQRQCQGRYFSSGGGILRGFLNSVCHFGKLLRYLLHSMGVDRGLFVITRWFRIRKWRIYGGSSVISHGSSLPSHNLHYINPIYAASDAILCVSWWNLIASRQIIRNPGVYFSLFFRL
jgi:hypothetical protein